MARTLWDIEDLGYRVARERYRNGITEATQTEFFNHDPFCLVSKDGKVVPCEPRGAWYSLRVKGLLGEGDGVDFEILKDAEVEARGLAVPPRGNKKYSDAALFDGTLEKDRRKAERARLKVCISQGRTAQELDGLASMGPSVVRLGDADHPWKALLDTALKDGRKIRFFEEVARSRGQGGFSTLTNSLIDFGGWRVVNPGREPDLEDILARGQLWPGSDPVMARGRRSQCHANSAQYWAKNMDRALLVTGYALTDDDGMWRQHSWCVNVTEDGPRIVETTEPRVAYFGFVMTAEEAAQFHEDTVGRKVRLPKAGMVTEPEAAPDPESEPTVMRIA